MDSRHEALRSLAASQDGQFCTAQALNEGLTNKALRCMRDVGAAESLRLGVWRFRHTPGDPDPAITAYLAAWPYAVIGGKSAAVYHGLKRITVPKDPEIVLPHGMRCRTAGITVYQTRFLPDEDILKVGSVRYTTLARTVLDLSDFSDPWESLSTLDDAVALGAKTTWINRRACQLAPGRAGVALIAKATSKEAPGIFKSWLERASGHIYRVAGIPDPEWNVRVYDLEGLIGEVDSLWRLWRVISEKEGLRHHTSRTQRRKDAKRFNRLLDAGYAARRFTWEDVVRDPVGMAATVLRALNSAGANGSCPHPAAHRGA